MQLDDIAVSGKMYLSSMTMNTNKTIFGRCFVQKNLALTFLDDGCCLRASLFKRFFGRINWKKNDVMIKRIIADLAHTKTGTGKTLRNSMRSR